MTTTALRRLLFKQCLNLKELRLVVEEIRNLDSEFRKFLKRSILTAKDKSSQPLKCTINLRKISFDIESVALEFLKDL